MRNKLLLLVLFSVISSGVLAQKELDLDDEISFKDRLYSGLGFSAQIQNNFFSVEASPYVGYMITPMFSAGVGITVRYSKFKVIDESVTDYGWRTFARHNLNDYFFLYTEYERLSYEFFFTDGSRRRWNNAFFVGGGIQQQLGSSNVRFVAMGLYNFAYERTAISPYTSPWVFRVGFTR